MRTPIRDQLGLNDPTAAAGGYTAEEIVSLRAQRAAQAALRAELRAGLSSLPAPENEYSVALPDELPAGGDEADQDGMIEEDAADIKARKAREAEAARLAAERKKSLVRIACFLSAKIMCVRGGWQSWLVSMHGGATALPGPWPNASVVLFWQPNWRCASPMPARPRLMYWSAADCSRTPGVHGSLLMLHSSPVLNMHLPRSPF